MAHTRLKVIDLSSGGAQPASLANSTASLVFNGEIYNYESLRDDLRREGCVFASRSDTEVLLQSLASWGEEAIRSLDGMFAFAFLDRRSGALVAARDAFGIKPLYYASVSGGVAVASELRCLLRLLSNKARVDPLGVASFLTFGSVYGPGTIIEGIRELPPGGILRVSEGRVEVDRWYRLPRASSGYGIAAEAAAREVAQLLDGAVRRQLQADVPTGVFLSGGMDSSAIATVAARTHGRSTSTITVAFDSQDAQLNEDAEAREFAASLGVRHRVVPVHERSTLDALDAIIASMDQPSADGVNTWVIARGVKSAGITVALSGLGGDEVFGGYGYLRQMNSLGWALQGLKVLGPFAAGAGKALAMAGRGRIGTRKAVALLRHSGCPGGIYAVRRALFVPEDNMGLVTSAGAAAWLERGLESMIAGVELDRMPPAQEATLFEFQNYLPFTLLRDTDMMSMAHALEVRVPLLDRALVEFVLGLPLSLRFVRGVQKPLLSKAVPEVANIGRRPKRGFTLPLARWIASQWRPVVEARLKSMHYAGAWVRPEGATEVFRRFVNGESKLWTRVWALFVLDRWLEDLEKGTCSSLPADRQSV